jgi:hypothetical protein
MQTMGEERDMFSGLGWEKEIRSLGDPHVPFINKHVCMIIDNLCNMWSYGIPQSQHPKNDNNDNGDNMMGASVWYKFFHGFF